MPLAGIRRGDEELHLHLLELEGPEDEVAGGDLVAERLADLGDPEGRLLAREAQDVLEVDEDALGRLGAQVRLVAFVMDWPDVGLEHQVELAGLRELAAADRAADLPFGLLIAELLVAQIVLAPAPLAFPEALDEGIGEAGEVPGCLPDLRVLDDRRVESDDVVALLKHRPPPLVLDVVLEQDAVVPVVVGVCEPAVDLRRREDESAPLAERDDLVELGELSHGLSVNGLHRGRPHPRRVRAAHYPLPSRCPSTSTAA
jgi:hypothetical protein